MIERTTFSSPSRLPRKMLLFAFFGLLLPASRTLSQESPHGPLSIPCNDCHSTEAWGTLPADMHFDHASTGYMLYGQHRVTPCRKCHTTLRFAGTSRTCAECHIADYQTAASINHRTAGFGTTCSDCHSETALSWQSSFDHGLTQFPTRGIHDGVPCTSCHLNNRYRGTPVQCVACHLRDYLATTNPNHKAAGLQTDCGACHRALTWQPAIFFPHPWFPISSGDRHRPGVWNTCADCHTTQPGYASFECIFCHEHERSRTDARHSDVPGYSYRSAACYQCHPSP